MSSLSSSTFGVSLLGFIAFVCWTELSFFTVFMFLSIRVIKTLRHLPLCQMMQSVSSGLQWVDVLSNHLTSPFSQFSPTVDDNIFLELPESQQETAGGVPSS